MGSFPVILSILGFAFVAEGYALWIAYKEVNIQKGNLTLIEWIKDGDDPTSVGVLIEDFIAVLGVLLASLGVASSFYFHNPVFDSITSIIIGLLLGGMAIIMGYANGRLLINRSVSMSSEQEIRDYLNSMPGIERIEKLTTEIISANEIKLSLEFDFNTESLKLDPILSEKFIKLDIDETDLKITVNAIGQYINKIEKRLQQKFPEIKYIDLEIN